MKIIQICSLIILATFLASIASASFIIPNTSITQAKMKIRTSTTTGVTIGNVLITGSSGGASTTSTSYVAVGSVSGTLAVLGNPVLLIAQPDGSGSSATFGSAPNPGSALSVSTGAVMAMTRDGTVIAEFLSATYASPNTVISALVPPGMSFLDLGATAGTHTYALKLKSVDGVSVSLTNIKLVAYEIK